MASSGIRWYRAFPTPLTQIVVAANKALWTGGAPISTYAYARLTQIQTFPQQGTLPVSFASVRDPAANNGNGSDILVICGFTGPYGFASGTLTLSGTPAAGQTITATLVGPGGSPTVTTAPYTVLASDNLTSIAKALAQAINVSAAVTPGAPFVAQATFSGAVVTVNALVSGTPGNSITVNGTVVNAGMAVAPTSATNMTGGGATTSAPLKYDGNTVSGLSAQIQRAFTNCVVWHDHLWLWGDPFAPDTLFASDIKQPEGFTFMNQYGGYDIGVGDGDPYVRACVPIGNTMYVFKGSSIHAATGYDFQSGEYQFQIQPAFHGVGTPAQECTTVLNNAVLFWSGKRFYRIRVGATDLEPIGATIPILQGRVSAGNQTLIRAAAGDFIVSSSLNESYSLPALTASEMFTSAAFFAVDVGSGKADTILVFDDDASTQMGQYAWSVWDGWTVEGWVPFGTGINNVFQQEPALLCWITLASNGNPQICAYGTNVASDNGLPITWLAQVGWVTLSKGALQKELHRIFLEMESTPGVIISATVTPSISSSQAGSPKVYYPAQFAFGVSGGISGAESHQTLIATLKPFLRANAYLFAFEEQSGTANFELISATLDFVEEAFTS